MGGAIAGDGGRDRRLSINLNRSDEAVASAGNGFDEARIASVIAEHLADLLNGGVESVVEFDERLDRPKLFPQFLPGDQFPMPLQEGLEDAARLLLEVDFAAVPEQLAQSYVQFKYAEAIDSSG